MSGYKRIFAFPILLSLFLLSMKAVAQSGGVVVLTDEQDQYPLGLQLEILEDKDGAWTIEDVTAPEIAAQFVRSQEEIPGFGFTDSAYWVRFQVRNEADVATKWLFFVDTDVYFIDYYLPDVNDQGYEVVKTGSALPFHTRDVPAGHYAFRLPVPPYQTETIYVRFKSEGTLILSLSIWSNEAFAQKTVVDQTLNSFLYGILFILAVYNLVLFFFLRDNSYIYYVLFFATILLTMMSLDGFGSQYLWPNWGLFAAMASRTFIVLSFTFALLFATTFLHTKEYTLRLHRIMLALAAAIVVVLGLQFVWFRETALIHVLLAVASCISMVIAGVLIWRKGYHPARYFLLSWVFILVGFIIFVLTLADVIPWTAGNIGILRLGLIILALFLSIGLADRINIIRQEKDKAQQELIRNQEEFTESLRQANKELESKFEERSQELSFAHEQIDVLFKDSTLAFGTAAMDGRVLTANDALKTILGYPNDEIFEANVLDFFADAEFRQKIMEQLSAGRYAQFPMVQLKRQDGSLFYANLTESILSRKDGDVLLGIVNDITEQVLAEQELHKRAEETAVAEERDRIARELHDSVTQSLYSASLIAEAVPKFWRQKPDEAAQDLEELRVLTQGAQAEMRTLLLELRPSELVDRKLSELLRQLTDAMSARTDLPISLTIAGDCQVSPDAQVAFYRITQEALNNINKHAKAGRAWVLLRCDQEHVTLRVGDDGRGFEPESRQVQQLGLNIMHERAEAIGADLTVESQPDQGTEVTVDWQVVE